MRVLHLNARAGYCGGVEQILHDIAEAFEADGHPQALLHQDPAPDRRFCDGFSAHGAIATDRHRLLKGFRPDVALIHKLNDDSLVADIADQMPTTRMVHDHDLYCPRHHKYFPLSAKICEKPAGSACFRHLCFLQKSPSGRRIPALRFDAVRNTRRGISAHRAVRRFIVGSRWMRDALSMNGIEHERIQIIAPIPRSVGAARPLPPCEAPNILFVGQVIRGKGVDLMLRALAQLKRPWRATLVGQGNHLDHCRRLAEKLALGDRVQFTGWVDHAALESHYRHAMFSVVPSRWPEPFGMVGVEAMARARPVVGFATGGIPDWLRDEKSGLLAPPADVGALAQQMDRLLGDTALRHRLGEQAAALVQRDYQPAQFIERLLSALRATNAPPAAPRAPVSQPIRTL